MVTTTTQLGTIEGIERDGVEQYLGIRFAEAPVGDRRFEAPVASDEWTGTYDATAHPSRSIQSPLPSMLGPEPVGETDEDCLFLNVYTPAADDRKRPVLFWIHGGAYVLGSANEYDGSKLAAQGDAVVVTINYRLGLLGFLDLSSLGDAYAGSASNGFRDQICALQWVNDHIASFGGDPDNITIFGESAGAGSVLALIASPSADGLYAKAIAHSPGGVNRKGDDLLPLIDPSIPGDGPLVDRLLAASTDELLAAQAAMGMTGGQVDGVVVTRHPVEAIRDRADAGVPIIIGTNRDEGTLFSAMVQWDEGLFDLMTAGVALEVTRGADPSEYRRLLAETHPDLSPIKLGEEIWNDLFRRTTVEIAEAASAVGKGAWVYRFDVPSSAFGGALGANHAGEIAFTFNWLNAGGENGMSFHDATPENQDLAQKWSDTVLSFARTGDPNGAGLPEWPQYSADDRRVLMLDHPPTIAVDPDEQHRKIWDEIR